ncbi:peptidase M4 family protein, partial [Enterobacter hormaechei]|nr:peptidase M4 family protein [Enterobacter hormaechei]MCE1727341.1 peptidase M4 family protein [Enterobacter hormaechei]
MQIQNNNYRGLIPPYILQNIYNNDNKKKKVLMTLNHTKSLMLDTVINESSDDSDDDDKVTKTTIHRSIHDAENKRKLPGKLVRDEGDP